MTKLKQIKNEAANIAAHLNGNGVDPDATLRVLDFIQSDPKRLERYRAALDERGEQTVNSEIAKVVKATLRAENDTEVDAPDGSLCLTYMRFKAR